MQSDKEKARNAVSAQYIIIIIILLLRQLAAQAHI